MSATNTLIPNNLLAFLQQKLGVMGELRAIQICSISFSVDEICKAKALLCLSLNQEAKCTPHKKGDQDGKKSLQDIIEILKETDPGDVLTFVTFENLDITCLKDIAVLKTDFADILYKLEVLKNTIARLCTKVDELRNFETRSTEASNNAAGQSPSPGCSYAAAEPPAQPIPRIKRIAPCVPATSAAITVSATRALCPPVPATPHTCTKCGGCKPAYPAPPEQDNVANIHVCPTSGRHIKETAI